MSWTTDEKGKSTPAPATGYSTLPKEFSGANEDAPDTTDEDGESSFGESLEDE